MTIHLTHRTGLAFAAIALGAGLFLLPAQAVAQASTTTATPAPAGAAPPAKTVRPVSGRNVEGQIKLLHSQLKITTAQEPQWNAVAQVMRDNAKSMSDLIQDRRAKQDSQDAIADLHSYETIAEAHVAGVKKLIPVFKTLYDTMSDAQKKNADTVFQARPRRAHAKKAA